MQLSLDLMPTAQEKEASSKKRNNHGEGLCFVAMQTTGIFCKPSCPLCKQSKYREVFPTLGGVIQAGYRPCDRCGPMDLPQSAPDWVQSLLTWVNTHPGQKITPEDWQALGLQPTQIRHWVKETYGLSFNEWLQAYQTTQALPQTPQQEDWNTLWLAEEAPYPSLSTDRSYSSNDPFSSPNYVAVQQLETPIGEVVAAAVDAGVCFLNFADRAIAHNEIALMRKQFDCPVRKTRHLHLDKLQNQLEKYFSGQLTEFSVPVVGQGTPFQTAVWAELQRIPYGETIAYDTLAQRLGQPTATRAVARANGQNRISILIPCHRVIGKDGRLTGYAGGIWRKRLLLELEHTGKLPGS
jgi:AraC family transcriptional regulator of adaptative response/methylated-DNA-[protein]-cysteine methyltransferase